MRGEKPKLQGAQPTGKEEGKAASPALDQGDGPSSSDRGTAQESQEAASHISPELNVSHPVHDVGAEGSFAGVDERRANVSIIADAIQCARRDRSGILGGFANRRSYIYLLLISLCRA